MAIFRSGTRAIAASSLAFLVFLPLCAAGPAAEKAKEREKEQVETYPDGKQKSVYGVTADGVRNGFFKEFYPDGKLKTQGAYRQGELNGPYRTFHPNGKIKLKAEFRAGEFHGVFEEFGEDGAVRARTTCRDGRFHGPVQEYAAGQLVKDEFWIDGELVIPRSAAVLGAELAAIQKMPVETVGEVPSSASAAVVAAVKDPAAHARREAALRALMSFRCICGLAYKDMKLDWTYIAHCEAGSQMLAKVGRLEHTPPNPGMPEAEYRFAFEGTSKSNLSSVASPAESVRMFMDDSDKGNIDRLGHRRWCLNPAMLKTGFGSSGGQTAMWSMDSSRPDVPDYDFVAFPPRGLVPTGSFKESYAWSVSLHPKKYQAPDAEAVKVQVFPARLNLRQPGMEKAPAPLSIGYFNVDTGGYGIPNCIIFRPNGVQVTAGSTYWVEIAGLKSAKGEEATVSFLVAFVAG